MPDFMDLTGQRFGRLVVVERVLFRHLKKPTYWKVLCDCGTKKIVGAKALRYGDTKSCGCLQREIAVRIASITGKTNKGRKHPNRRKPASRIMEIK